MKKHHAGFTLMEILIALIILAIIGGMLVVGLQSSIRTQNSIMIKSNRLAAVQSAIAVLERDVLQIINRPIINESGQLAPAIALSLDDKQQVFEFTHAGYINPFALQNRTTMQRVSYALDGKDFTRTTWAVLDRTSNSQSQANVLLTGVSAFSVDLYYPVLDNNGKQTGLDTKQSTSQIQEATPTGTLQAQNQPIAVSIKLEVDGIGTITRFIPLAG